MEEQLILILQTLTTRLGVPVFVYPETANGTTVVRFLIENSVASVSRNLDQIRSMDRETLLRGLTDELIVSRSIAKESQQYFSVFERFRVEDIENLFDEFEEEVRNTISESITVHFADNPELHTPLEDPFLDMHWTGNPEQIDPTDPILTLWFDLAHKSWYVKHHVSFDKTALLPAKLSVDTIEDLRSIFFGYLEMKRTDL